LVQLTLSLSTTSGSSVDISTSWEEESAPCVLTGSIVPPGSDNPLGADVLTADLSSAGTTRHAESPSAAGRAA
jgi:hypothetical protein